MLVLSVLHYIYLNSRESGFETAEMKADYAARRALYEELLLRSKQGLDSISVDESRTHFDLQNGAWIPTTTSTNASFVCAAIPEGQINKFHALLLDIKRIIDDKRLDPSSSCAFWVQPKDMHVTIFQTSHYSDPVPDVKYRRVQVIDFLNSCVSNMASAIFLYPERVIIASSGAVLLLYNALEGAKNDGIEYIRSEAASKLGDWLPRKQTRVIWHSTLGRILENVPLESLRQAQHYCDVESSCLRNKIGEIEIKKLWYVEEEALYSMKGPRIEVILNE
uniref:Uncharacterized protein AlNc14C393G11302 n=1 Tax=Albugo laibachii Nc14 TaxID=890382 RepID=F0WYN9_9STRA|nr:conserved hypothetical protein [Albugo laibachii Nc14]|eukprot:CCA26598.1 conserved hypothetical protein [Albugo laibachii Nc14]